jgi:L-ascorbate metabolism protein UlaG (beta-lactamase superfamily)
MNYEEDGMTSQLTFYGHATFGLQVDAQRLLFDPFFSGNPAASASADEVEADFILVSHGHGDHIGDTLMIAKRTGATVIAVAEIADWLHERDVKTHAQHLGGGYQYPFGYCKLTLALHGSELPDGSCGGNPAGFLLTLPDKKKLYFAGDTGLFGDMRLIGDEGVDMALLPIGDNYTMGPADALRAVEFLRPKIAIPMHYNTFPLIKQDAQAWKRQVEEKTDSKVVILKPGDTYPIA